MVKPSDCFPRIFVQQRAAPEISHMGWNHSTAIQAGHQLDACRKWVGDCWCTTKILSKMGDLSASAGDAPQLWWQECSQQEKGSLELPSV